MPLFESPECGKWRETARHHLWWIRKGCEQDSRSILNRRDREKECAECIAHHKQKLQYVREKMRFINCGDIPNLS